MKILSEICLSVRIARAILCGVEMVFCPHACLTPTPNLWRTGDAWEPKSGSVCVRGSERACPLTAEEENETLGRLSRPESKPSALLTRRDHDVARKGGRALRGPLPVLVGDHRGLLLARSRAPGLREGKSASWRRRACPAMGEWPGKTIAPGLI